MGHTYILAVHTREIIVSSYNSSIIILVFSLVVKYISPRDIVKYLLQAPTRSTIKNNQHLKEY